MHQTPIRKFLNIGLSSSIIDYFDYTDINDYDFLYNSDMCAVKHVCRK